ncbi:MAG: cyanoexosortase A system-associated protein, partial [Synechocystis sp.]
MENSVTPPSKLRLGFLAVLAIAVLAQFGFTLARPGIDEDAPPVAKTIPYPQDVPLPGWQLQSSQAKKSPHKLIDDGHLYTYEKNNKKLTAQTHLEVNKPGAVNHYLGVNGIPISPLNLELKSDPERGTYGIVKQLDKTYLSACLNAAGKSTFEQGELNQNRYQYGISPLGVIGWVIGVNDLTDNRCLLTIMAIPVETPNELNHQKNVQQLEAAWVAWYDWWKPQLQT